MDQTDVAAARAALFEFMARMKTWEETYHRLYKRENGGPEQHADSARIELLQIYGEFLTQKERKTGRLAGPNAGYPPEFDPNCEKFVSADLLGPGKLVIETLWTHPAISDFSEKHRFTMIRKSGAWLLDKKESYSAYKEKWENRVL